MSHCSWFIPKKGLNVSAKSFHDVLTLSLWERGRVRVKSFICGYSAISNTQESYDKIPLWFVKEGVGGLR